MEKEFVPYELAVKLKTIGFDEPCLSYSVSNTDASGRTWTSVIVAPLYQQAFRWFREKYGLYHQMHNRLIDWGVAIRNIQTADIEWSDGDYISYEESELACLTKLIEIVKQTKN